MKHATYDFKPKSKTLTHIA